MKHSINYLLGGLPLGFVGGVLLLVPYICLAAGNGGQCKSVCDSRNCLLSCVVSVTIQLEQC